MSADAWTDDAERTETSQQTVKQPDGEGRVTVTLAVNGRARTARVRTDETLLDALRALRFHGVRYGCGVGVCGACTVLRSNDAVNSCLTLAALCDGVEVTTVEGLARDDALDEVQRTFVEQRASQCSYCTPGFVLALAALLARDPSPSAEDVREALSGHICRCGSYSRIIRAAMLLTGNVAAEQVAES